MVENWTPDQIAFVIMTVKRPSNYLSKTMASMSSEDPQLSLLKDIGIAVDDTDVSWIPAFQPPRKINIVPLTNEERIRASHYHLHQRACHNFHRALQVTTAYRGLIVCEDDIVVRKGWISKLCQTLNEMQEMGLSDFVLSLYSPYNHEAHWLRRGTYYSSYLASDFYGSQCVFYSAGEVQEIGSLVWNCGVERYEEPFDLLVKRHCVRKQNLYATRVALAQHIGRISTGLGTWHSSPTFHLPWPDDYLNSRHVPRPKKGIAGTQ